MMNRSAFSPYDSVAHIWKGLGLPEKALKSLNLPHDADCCPSSFKVDHLAQTAIAASALAAALFRSVMHGGIVPRVTVPIEHACAEFKSERLYVLNGRPAPSSWGTLGGLHKTMDGYVRMHDSFPNHRERALDLLCLPKDAPRSEVARKMLEWKSFDLETAAFENGCVIAALRSFDEWDPLPQAKAIPEFPILLSKIADMPPYSPNRRNPLGNTKCLRGIRVVDMSRVIAAPVAGRTLAAHGADVMWVTSPNLPDLPDLDIDTSRGKRSVQINIKHADDKAVLIELLRTADVFLQGYRPGSLAVYGLSTAELVKINPNLIIANLNAYGPQGPWSHNRGFDSLVQTCSGLNVADAQRYGINEPVRVLPCQALDHGAGYFLAAGIIASLYRRAIEGGAFEIQVSLAGVMKYLRSLGQYEGQSGFSRKDLENFEDYERYLETRETSFGELCAVTHAACIEGVDIGWDSMPKSLGSDRPIWLQ
ncbi:CoA-transferase family III [Plenodomus tracheiphilus IPT5]|uniref:CoA-transferase family III n=1 Tax=Plenodomus tracheiphilus IPT5 TaxID=1408161 RepID=A0A6A7AVR1_9PLEO|nr:CoA-transferase family III [Plenodomus tracheiphilus IPT5]